jgi:hypothetical protein
LFKVFWLNYRLGKAMQSLPIPPDPLFEFR